MNKESLTKEQLMSLLSYDQNTGLFTWISAKRYGLLGSVAGTQQYGYTLIRINRTGYLAHRLAWLYCYGEFPRGDLDHINGNPSDNRICNLRIANQSQNMQNKAMYKVNKSGYLGTYPVGRKFGAKIKRDGKPHYLGLFITAEEAHEAYKVAKSKIHTFNPRVRE